MGTFRVGTGQSLSEQAKASIQNYIKQMDLSKGNKLPREEKLAELIGVSRITIRAALNDLATEGIIFRRQGKGTFVNVDSLNVKVTFSPVIEFTQMIANSGYHPGVKNLSVSDYTASQGQRIKEKLFLDSSDELTAMERVFLADGTVCAYTVDIFSKSLLNGGSYELLQEYEKSIYEYIYARTGQRILWDKLDLHVVNAGELPNYQLYLKESFARDKPLLFFEGINYDQNDMPLIYSMEYINAHIIQFGVIRQRKINYI
jgi:GntR family transcriptional regulator